MIERVIVGDVLLIKKYLTLQDGWFSARVVKNGPSFPMKKMLLPSMLFCSHKEIVLPLNCLHEWDWCSVLGFRGS